jgi:hypothetical protein
MLSKNIVKLNLRISMKKLFQLLLICSFSASYVFAGSPLADLKTERDKQKFANKQFQTSISHGANAVQTKNAKMSGVPIDKPELYRNVKKIAILGVTVAFTSGDGSGNKDEKSYGGIPVEHFNELSDSVLNSIYMAFEAEGFKVVKLDEVMKAPSYSKIDFGKVEESSRYGSNNWISTALNSKWVEPDNVNSVKSGITLVHSDTVKARALVRNKPFQQLVQEVGADAGINIAVRFYVSGGEIIMGWGPLKRGLVVDMIPATGDPRVIWSNTLKSDLELDIAIGKFDKKSGMYSKSWKYNLKSSIPALSVASLKVFETTAIKLKMDQVGEK